MQAFLEIALAVLLLTGVTLIAGGLGYKVLRLVRVSFVSSEHSLFAIGIGLGLMSYVMFALGVAGLLYQWVVYLVVGLLGVLVLPELRSIAGQVNEIPRSWTWSRQRWPEVVLIIVLVIVILFNFVATLAPISSADALVYHFVAVKKYVQEHRLVEIPWSLRTYYPFNIEMLFLLGTLLWRDSFGALFNFLFGVLTVIAMFPFARRHITNANPVLGSAIFYLSGLVAWESTSAFIELGLTLYVLLSIWSFLNWSEDRRSGWLVLSGVFGGLAAGSKLNGLVFPAILGLLLVMRLIRARDFRLTPLLRFGLPVMLAVGPWYAKNYVQTGNPVFPFFPEVFGSRNVNWVLERVASDYGYGKSLLHLLRAPFDLTWRGHAYDVGELLGPLFLSFLPVALLRGVKTERVKILWGIVGLYFFVWFYTSQQTRFLLPILPLLALLCSIAASTLLRADRFLRTAVVVMVGLALTFGTLVSLFYDWQFLPVVFHLESRDSFLSRKTWFYDEIKWMNQHLPSDARVSMLGTMPYYLDREYAMTLADVRGFDYVFCAGECSLSQVTGLELIRQTQAVVPLSRTLNKGTLTMPTFLWRIQEASP